jgi:hypothetical protein
VSVVDVGPTGLVVLVDGQARGVLVVADECTDEDITWLRRHYDGPIARRSDGPADFDG